MKKYIISLFLFCAAVFTQAQTFEKSYANGQFLGVELGFNRPILRYQFADKQHPLYSFNNAPVSMNGAKIGLVYEAGIIKGFGCRMGINYAIAGNHTIWQSGNTTMQYPRAKEKYWMHEISIPVDWQYKFTIAKETFLLLYTGPTFVYQLGYQTETSVQLRPNSDAIGTTSNHFTQNHDGDNLDDYSHFNLTWGIGAGFQYKQFYLRGGYDFGIYNHFRDHYYNVTDDLYYKNNARMDEWNIRLGIYFLNF